MEKWSVLRWFWIVVQLYLIAQSSAKKPWRRFGRRELISSSPVVLHRLDQHVVLDNGLVKVTLSTPMGMVTGIEYGGIDNLLDLGEKEGGRGYWDVVWSTTNIEPTFYQIEGTDFRVIREDENQIELSFSRTWNGVKDSQNIPLSIDKRFIMLRGSHGFYSYAIYEHLPQWPDVSLMETRIAFKLQEKLFNYMAISDDRQRIMPTAQDRINGETLAFREAVLLTNPENPTLKGEVDDKYQYSSNNIDNRVHGWVSSNNPPVGFWVITPSDEFRVGGPFKQELTSHTGPTSLSVFFSAHYTGEEMTLKVRNGEPWKKVYGPVFIYLNSVANNKNPQHTLWEDAKSQMQIEVNNWPYNFPLSPDFPHADQRGTVHGRLLVSDKYMNIALMAASSANVGLAPPGDAGSWQLENKGYQFWTQADADGTFDIKGVRPGTYKLYAWVRGTIGDYMSEAQVIVTPGSDIKLGDLIFTPLRNGPTLWEIGIPDRTAAEFYVPEPNPTLMNRLYTDHADKFRQYGLWDRYTDLYPEQDLIFTVGVSDYHRDWFFAQVNRKLGYQKYVPTTWQIVFDLKNVNPAGTYTLRVALASATMAEVQVRINNPNLAQPDFTTRLIGRENAIARHGIHGLYRLYNIDILGSKLVNGRNTIYLTQARGSNPFMGVMYDYIRLEGPQ